MRHQRREPDNPSLPPPPLSVVIVEKSKHRVVFDVFKIPPKWAITLMSIIAYDVPTLKVCLPSIYPQTNTVMDYQQWADMLGRIALESRHADQFSYVEACACESGGPCCEAVLQMSVTNSSETEELPIYSDDIATVDQRVLPVHRTFSVRSAQPGPKPDTYLLETDVPHSFDDGDLVTVLDSRVPLPKWCRATSCTASPVRLTLISLGLAQTLPLAPAPASSADKMVAHISKRQLLYYLAPGETISLRAIVRKGTGRQHINWSPVAGNCSYRPLFRDMTMNSAATASFSPAQRIQLVATCPKGVFDIEDDQVVIARPDDCDACRRCERWAEEVKIPGLVQLSKKKLPDWQRFTVQTNGSIDAIDAVLQGMRIIRARLTGRSDAAAEQLMFPELPKKPQ